MDINYWWCLEVNRGQREQQRAKGGCLGFLKAVAREAVEVRCLDAGLL